MGHFLVRSCRTRMLFASWSWPLMNIGLLIGHPENDAYVNRSLKEIDLQFEFTTQNNYLAGLSINNKNYEMI